MKPESIKPESIRDGEETEQKLPELPEKLLKAVVGGHTINRTKNGEYLGSLLG